MSQRKIETTSNNVSVTPKGKKLVQARLPFKTLASTPKVGIDSLVTAESRKRKLSTSDEDGRSNKLSKTAGAKENVNETDKVTVLEMVDLVDDDIVMTANDVTSNAALTKQTKKSTKETDVVDEKMLRRSTRKNDSDVPAKVVIKIPSAKKKKPIERKVDVVSKIDEADDDDDVILLDSEENSLNSVDGKEKGANGKVDDSIVILNDENSFASAINSEVADSTTTVTEDPIEQSVDSSGNSSGKREADEINSTNDIDQSTSATVVSDAGSSNTSPIHTKTLDANIDVQDEVSSTSEKIDSNSNDRTDVTAQNALAVVEEMETSDSDSVVVTTDEPVKMDTDANQSKISTPNATAKKRTRQSVDNNIVATPKTPLSKTSDDKSLTPKQLQKKMESEQRRLAKEKAKEERERKIQEAKEERERKIQEAKEERERKLQEEKEQRQREKDEKERQKKKERDDKEEQRRKEREDKEEQKRKEREDKEEQRRKEKEEREKKKQAEIDAKNEEKRQKEEERVAKEEAELKKKRKEAEAFTKFFAKKSNKSTEPDKIDVDDVECKLNFRPFRVKPDMRLAPIVRRKLSPTRKSKFDGEVLNSTGNNYPLTDLYIHSLRKGKHAAEKQGKTWPNEDNNDDLIIVDDMEGGTPIEETSSIQKYRAKFFKFEENRRPPYYGTWQKKSSVIKPRKPFVTDQKFFDYEIDSDDEWEDEEPGESLHGSDDEKDKESDDDYDIDNEFFVPHGHLSDEELANNDEIDDDNSPDTQKAKLKIMQKAFSDEMKKKTEKIKPRLIGLIWQNKDGSQPMVCPNVIWEMLQMRSMIFNGPTIVMPIVETVVKQDASDEKNSTVKKRVKLTDESVTDLIRLIHGNTNSYEFLSKEFRAFTAQKNKDNEKFQEFSLSSIRLKIKELAEWKPCPDEGPLMNKYCWYVSAERRKHHNLDDLPIINDWNYLLTPKTKAKAEAKKVKENDKSPPEASDEIPSAVKTPKSKLGNIAKFTKVLSDDDKKKNFSIPNQEPAHEQPSPKPKPDPSPKPAAKKRVNLLMSVPRGQEIPVQTKNSLISQYLSSANSNKKSTDVEEPICID